jgi:hypothetical protein
MMEYSRYQDQILPPRNQEKEAGLGTAVTWLLVGSGSAPALPCCRRRPAAARCAVPLCAAIAAPLRASPGARRGFASAAPTFSASTARGSSDRGRLRQPTSTALPASKLQKVKHHARDFLHFASAVGAGNDQQLHIRRRHPSAAGFCLGCVGDPARAGTRRNLICSHCNQVLL